MENENQNLIAALKYAEKGWSVIPLCTPIDAEHCIQHSNCKSPGKTSLVNWAQYQNERASPEQIKKWFELYPNANVGVITGAISNMVVVDIDTVDKVDCYLPSTATSKTGGGGKHCFYRHPGKNVKTRARIIPNVDIRGDGGYVAMPPSLHKSGNCYEWIVSPEESDFADLPEWVLLENENKSNTTTDWEHLVNNEIPNGVRNQTNAQLTGKLLSHLPLELWEAGWLTLKAINQSKGNPPLSEKELRTIFDSISEREAKKRASNLPTEVREIRAISLSELINTEFKNPQWLVDRLIPHEAVTILSGAPATYKTFLTLEIALKVAGGEKVFGEFQAIQSPVLIIDEENHARILKDRAKLLSRNLDLPIFIASKNSFQLGEKSTQKVIEYAKSKNARLVIFDSFICIHDADENIASEMRTVMKYLKEIASQGISVIVIHHHRKKGKEKGNASQDIRGSSDIVAQVDCHLAVDRKGRDSGVTMQQIKLREAPEIKPFTIRFHSDGDKANFEYTGDVKEGQNKRSELKALTKKILETTDKPNRTQLWMLIQQAGTTGGEATFKTALKEMVEARELFSKKGTKNSTLYSLKEFSSDDG